MGLSFFSSLNTNCSSESEPDWFILGVLKRVSIYTVAFKSQLSALLLLTLKPTSTQLPREKKQIMTNHTKEPRGTITATEWRPLLRSSPYRNTSQPATSSALQIPNLQLSITRVPHPPKHALSSKPQPFPVSTPLPVSGLPAGHS